MIVLPDPKNPIPEQLKSDNWAFHRMARSDDPAYRCQNIGNLVNNLIATITIAGIDDTIIDYLLILPEGKDEQGKVIPPRQRVFRTISGLYELSGQRSERVLELIFKRQDRQSSRSCQCGTEGSPVPCLR